MKQKFLIATMTPLVLLAATASADVWKWTDPLGKTHFVESSQPMFTWIDDSGKVAFSDTPDHRDAGAVQFVWHSRGSLTDVASDTDSGDEAATAANSEEQQSFEQRKQEYCQQLEEMYNSYKNTPELYRMNEDGEREYLSKREVRQKIREITEARNTNCK